MAQFIQAAAPSWQSAGIVPLSLLAAITGHFYSKRLARGVIIWREWLVLLMPIVLATRVSPYVLGESSTLGAELSSWIVDPLSIFDGSFTVRLLVVVGAWATAFFSTQELNDIRIQRGEVSEEPARTIIERAWEGDRLRSIDHTTPFARLAARFIWGGVGLIIMSAMTSTGVPQMTSIDSLGELLAFRNPSSSVALLNVLVYFVAVLLLLAEAQYARTRTVWTLEHVALTGDLSRRWAGIAVALVGSGLVAALLAPTDGLLGISDLFQVGLNFFMTIAAYVMAGLLILVFLLLWPLKFLMGGSTEPDSPGRGQPFLPPPPPSSGDDAIFEIIKSLLFWGLLLGLLAYSATSLWRQRTLDRFIPGLQQGLERLFSGLFRVLRGVVSLLRAFGRQIEHAARYVRSSAANQVNLRLRGRRRGPMGGDARRLVVALYESMLDRADAIGISRRTGQTAAEFRVRLSEGVPDAAEDVEGITRAFERARYSAELIDRADVGAARRHWQRIRAHLRASRLAR